MIPRKREIYFFNHAPKNRVYKAEDHRTIPHPSDFRSYQSGDFKPQGQFLDEK